MKKWLLLLAVVSAQAFEIPQPGHVFTFPYDYGAHPGFRIEWWYVTGHLYSLASDKRPFGFQATFFRLAGPPMGPDENPDFSRQEVYLAHMALTDITTGKFYHEERLNRKGWDAHIAVGTLNIANGAWSLRLDRAGRSDGVPPSALEVKVNHASAGAPAAPPSLQREQTVGAEMSLVGAVEADAAFHLKLTARKPLVVFGENGVSHKGAEASAASYYLTFSRLDAEGDLRVDDHNYRVQGEAWMDHEISSSQLGSNQVGWDWTCIQLNSSPRELMLYRMRRADGSADPASRLQWVSPAGQAITEPFTWTVLSTWKSPRSKATYPARVRLTTTDPDTHAPATFILEPMVKDQELDNSLGGGPYWEGACRVLDAEHHEVGSAYLELTGYARKLNF